MEKTKLTLHKKNDALYVLSNDVTAVEFAFVCHQSVGQRGSGWWVNPQSSARRSSRKLWPTAHAAVRAFYSHIELLDPTKKVACTGEAHRNAHIDNCMVCMPEWADITVCFDCDHRPSQHAPDGCHGEVGGYTRSGATPTRCKCARPFTTQGGVRRLKQITVTVDYRWSHGAELSGREGGREEQATYAATNDSDALSQSRAMWRERFDAHVKECAAEAGECFLSGSQSARSTSNGFLFARNDEKTA